MSFVDQGGGRQRTVKKTVRAENRTDKQQKRSAQQKQPIELVFPLAGLIVDVDPAACALIFRERQREDVVDVVANASNGAHDHKPNLQEESAPAVNQLHEAQVLHEIVRLVEKH